LKRILSLLLVLLLLAGLSACALQTTRESNYDISIVTRAETKAPETKEAPPETKETPPETKETPTETTEAPTEPDTTAAPTEPGLTVTEDGVYDSKEEVALYIHLYRHLPSNYITKKQAEDLGWPGGSLEPYAPGKCIGGSYFGNYEGLLPKAKGREWTECDIDTLGKKSRGAKRIIFSNDGLIYYTGDHYESFEKLYDGWED
jgi:Guanyl-specific ribonuclease Sa